MCRTNHRVSGRCCKPARRLPLDVSGANLQQADVRLPAFRLSDVASIPDPLRVRDNSRSQE
jgi:hypothetical protein